MIEQFTPPNKLTKEPYGTLMKVYTGEEPIYWVQTSLKTYLPKWKSMNMILCTVFSDILGNDMNVSEEFVDCCIDFVKNRGDKDLRKINAANIIEIIRKELK